MTTAAPGLAASGAAPFEALPPDLRVRAFGVDYAHLRLPEGGDLYLTRFGWPLAAQLHPAQWYADEWYARQGQRLPGSTGTAYHVRTRPRDGRSVDLVVKFSRVAQDVPLTIATSFPEAVTAEALARARFNSPLEEMGLLMELRRGEAGRHRPRVLTQHPLAIYAPAREYPLWQLGRCENSFVAHDRLLAEDQEGAVRAVELDIRRLYILLYRWVKGSDAEECHRRGALAEPEFLGLAPRVIAELKARGFRVLDNKPKHFILREDRRGRLLRRRDGQLAYGLVDYELLEQTEEHRRQFKVRQRRRYWDLLRHQDEAAPAELPAHLARTRIFGVSYLFGTGPDGGQLWVVGQDPELWDFFAPDRWLRTSRLKLSPMNEVFRTRTRDNIHVVYRRSRVGTRPRVDPLLARDRQIRDYGFNSPFEEVAIAHLLRQMGVRTTLPRAIYRTGHPTTTAEYLRDDRRFFDHADLTTPGPAPEPILSRTHDYYTVWDCFRGAEREGAAAFDLERARDDGLLDAAQHAEVLASTRERLARVGFAADALQDHECVVWLGSGGSLLRDRAGRIEVSLVVDALTAYEYELLGEPAYRQIISGMDERLRAVDCECLDLMGNHLLLTMDPDGRLASDAAGEPLCTLCNFELVRGLYRPLRS